MVNFIVVCVLQVDRSMPTLVSITHDLCIRSWAHKSLIVPHRGRNIVLCQGRRVWHNAIDQAAQSCRIILWHPGAKIGAQKSSCQ
jgi:hypothetical protein